MKKTKKAITAKLREIRKSLKNIWSVDTTIELADIVDKKLEWILNILIIWFDDEKYKQGDVV